MKIYLTDQKNELKVQLGFLESNQLMDYGRTSYARENLTIGLDTKNSIG